MSSKISSNYSSKTSWDQEIPDAPPAYSATADYVPPPPQQQQVYTPPMNPNYVPSVPLTPPVARYQPPPQQYQQVDYYNAPNPKASSFSFNSNRGLIGNALDFASHSVSGVTSRASAKTNNDATKAILDTVGGFLENRLAKKDQKKSQKEMRCERREMRRGRENYDRHYCSSSCNHPAPPQCYGGCTHENCFR